MKKSIYFLAILLMLLIASCKENSQINKYEIFIDNKLIPGQNFNFFYNTKHIDAKLNDATPLLIDVFFPTKKGVKYYRLKMEKYDELDGVFKSNFQIPSDAYFLNFEIFNESDIKIRTHSGFKIRHPNGKDLENSNLSLMMTLENIEDIMNCFSIEDSLYYKNYDRFSKLGSKLIKIKDTTKINEKLKILKSYSYTPNSLEMIDLYSNIATMSFFLKQYDTTQLYLIKIKNNLNLVKDFNEINFSNTLNVLTNIGNKPSKIVSLNPTKDSIVKIIFSIANNSQNKSLLLNFSRYMYLDTNLFNNQETSISNYLKNLSNLIMQYPSIDPSYINTFSSSLISLVKMNNTYKKIDFTDDLKRIGDEYFQKFNYKIAKDTNDYTFVGSDESRTYDNFLYDIAISYDLQGKTVQSQNILLNLTKKSKEIAFLSSKYLFNNYCKIKNLDSVIKYVNLMHSLHEKITEQEFHKFNKVRTELSLDTVKFENYFDKKPSKIEIPLSNTFNSSNRIYNTNLLRDSLLIIFYISDDCPSCNISLVPLLEKLEKQKKSNPINVIVASNLDIKYLESHYGKNISFIKRPTSIFDILKIKPYDYGAIFIKNKKIINSYKQIYSDEKLYLNELN